MNNLKKWFHFNIVCKITNDPAIKALGLISGIRYNLGIAKEGVDYTE